MDKLKAFEVFVTIVDRGGLARAADALRISPTMVSTYLAWLEQELGRKLLDRTTRRVDLTREGKCFLEDARRILAEVEAAEEGARGASAEPRGRVRVAAPDAVGRRFVIPSLPAFHARYPNIGIDLMFTDQARTWVPRGFDVLIRVGPVDPGEAEVRMLGTTRFVHVASPDYLCQNGSPTSPEELDKHRCIIYAPADRTEGFRWSFTINGKTRWYRPPAVMSFNDGDAMARMAVAGVGITRTLEMLVNEELADGRLVKVLVNENPELFSIHAVAPFDRAQDPVVVTLLNFLESLAWPRSSP